MLYDNTDSAVLSNYATAQAALADAMMLWKANEVGDMRDHIAESITALQAIESALAAKYYFPDFA
jgi:hypothetical protein